MQLYMNASAHSTKQRRTCEQKEAQVVAMRDKRGQKQVYDLDGQKRWPKKPFVHSRQGRLSQQKPLVLNQFLGGVLLTKLYVSP